MGKKNYEQGIYSDVEADDFQKHDKPPTEKQIDLLHNLASELEIKLTKVDSMTREEVSEKIDELKEQQINKRAEELAQEKEKEYGK